MTPHDLEAGELPIPIEPGELRWDPRKTLAWAGPTVGFLLLAPATARLDTVGLLVVLLVLFLGVGHVVGVHRGLIHRGWRTWPWLERALVWLGSLAGMTGLLDLVYQHDLRDHWQNQLRAPAVYAYRHGLWTDFVWYLHCRWTPRPDAPAALHYAPPRRTDIHDVPFYAWLQRTWRLQQLGLAVGLFVVGGWPWVVWGVLGRLAITRTGFWLVNYLAHTHGTLAHPIAGSCEQGRNNAWFGLVSFGEAWHNNHHAWPSSAQVGVEPWQVDPAWRFIQLLQRLGLAWDVQDVTSTLKRPCEGAARRSARRGRAAARRPAHW